MSNHPTIAALKAALESERETLSDTQAKSWTNPPYVFLVYDSYKSGHEAATERLMAIVEMYEDTLTAIDGHIREMQNEKIISMKEMCRALKVISDKYRPEQFPTTLADASGEIKKEDK